MNHVVPIIASPKNIVQSLVKDNNHIAEMELDISDIFTSITYKHTNADSYEIYVEKISKLIFNLNILSYISKLFRLRLNVEPLLCM